jgi:hypothetical protein
MRLRFILACAAVGLLLGAAAEAGVLRVVVVEASDAAAYAKALEQGKTLMKAKGLPADIRVWRARFAGDRAGSVVAAIEYPSLEALAKADATMNSDPELKAWLAGLSNVRKIISDSIYDEVKP